MRGGTNATAGPKEGTNILKFSNGLKIMWGTKNTNANDTSASITFPEAFSNTDYTITVSAYDRNGQNLWSFYCGTRGKSTTGVDAALYNIGGNGWSVASAVAWIAIGY